MYRTVIERGYMIPVVRNEMIEDGVFAFDGSKITYVGSRRGFDAPAFHTDKVIDATGKAVLPGLVNIHTHLLGANMNVLTEDIRRNSNTRQLYK